MIFNKKKRITDKLLKSFGQPKDDSFNFDLIERYFRKKDHSGSFHTISDKTCNDLDFQQLFMFIDRTTSKIGQQYLYNKLRSIPGNSDKESKQENLIEHFSNQPDFRVDVQKKLHGLQNTNVYHITQLFQDEHVKPPKWFFITRILSFTSLFSVLLLPINPRLFFVLFGVFFINLIIHFWNKRNLYQYLGSIPQLLRLIKVASELFKVDILKNHKPKTFKIVKHYR
jgi:hypothetical protein